MGTHQHNVKQDVQPNEKETQAQLKGKETIGEEEDYSGMPALVSEAAYKSQVAPETPAQKLTELASDEIFLKILAIWMIKAYVV